MIFVQPLETLVYGPNLFPKKKEKKIADFCNWTSEILTQSIKMAISPNPF